MLLGITVLLAFVTYELVWLTTSTQLQALRNGINSTNPNAPPPEMQIRSIEAAIQNLRPAQLTRLGVGLVAGLGTIVVIVFAASHIGTEWVWGTLRTTLAAGAGRVELLASKYVTLAGFALLYVTVGLAATTAASYLVSSQAGLDTGGYDLGMVASAGARTLFGFLPYMALAALIALWFRSAGGGIAAGLVINFTESLVTQLLVQLNRDFVSVANFGISRNVQSISRVDASPPAGAPSSVLATLPDQPQAVVLLTLWTILFVALAFWRLRSRDITLA